MAGVAAIKPDHGREPGVPEEGTPGSAALPGDPWNAEWQPRTPGPTKLSEVEKEERRHAAERIERAGGVEIDLRFPQARMGSARPSHAELHLVVAESDVEVSSGTPQPPAILAAPATETTDPTEGYALQRRHRFGRAVRTACYLLVLTLAASLWYFSLGTLVVSRGAALASGWDVTTVATGSMSPAIDPGDLVAYAPVDPADLRVGQIVVVDNPAAPGTMLVHRFAGFNNDGTLTTKGDANEKPDSTPVPVEAVRGVVKMVSPFGGYPTMLLNNGQTIQLAALIGLLLLVAIVVHAPVATEPATGRRRRWGVRRA